MEYFEYLPFASVFSSSDKLHADVYPALAEAWQIFMPFANLKVALRELADLGSRTYADYPPVEMDNEVTRAYDRFMPGWRIGANEPPSPRDPIKDKLLMEHLKAIEEAVDAHKAKRR
jgi:hypothetical protein